MKYMLMYRKNQDSLCFMTKHQGGGREFPYGFSYMSRRRLDEAGDEDTPVVNPQARMK
jgi:hypothetical protein